MQIIHSGLNVEIVLFFKASTTVNTNKKLYFTVDLLITFWLAESIHFILNLFPVDFFVFYIFIFIRNSPFALNCIIDSAFQYSL